MSDIDKTSVRLDLPVLCKLAVKAANAAAAIITQHRQLDIDYQHKTSGGSESSQVVTEIDHRAQQAIIDLLRPSLQQYDLALLAEESADDRSRLLKRAFWCIDPMDGTLAFIRRTAGCAVSIALVDRRGKPLLGVVIDPDSGDSYQAIQGLGVLKNDSPLSKPQLDRNAPLVLCADPSFAQHPWLQQTESGLREIARNLGLPDARIDYQIGAVMKAIRVSGDANVCYFKYPRNDNSGGSLWDYAATTCLFNELDLIASDFFGKPPELNRRDSTFMEHKGIIFSTSTELASRLRELQQSIKSQQQA